MGVRRVVVGGGGEARIVRKCERIERGVVCGATNEWNEEGSLADWAPIVGRIDHVLSGVFGAVVS